MLRLKSKPLLLLLFSSASFHLSAQESGFVDPRGPVVSANEKITIREIILTGNRKTRKNIILRELPFRSGEQYDLSDVPRIFDKGKKQLMNTALFYQADLALVNRQGEQADIEVNVLERCYLFPIPYFETVDRNLNQWLVEQKGDLSRVNLGARINYNNTTGRNDKLRCTFITGYTHELSLNYARLYIDKKLRVGLSLGISAGKNREINYNTVNGRQVFMKDENKYLRNFFRAGAEISYRKAITTRHSFGIQYAVEEVSDTVIAMNPFYFKSGGNQVRYPSFYYTFSFMDLDYNPYPTKGTAIKVYLGRKGLNKSMNEWNLNAHGLVCLPLNPRLFFKISAFGMIRLPFSQPYFERRLLGYGDEFLQGYENYVIDGVAGGYLKTTLTQKLLNFQFKSPVKKNKASYQVPVRIFGKIYGNAGYAYDPHFGENELANTFLYSGGFGIDILASYNFTLKLEWTFNRLGQNGLFLHQKSIF